MHTFTYHALNVLTFTMLLVIFVTKTRVHCKRTIKYHITEVHKANYSVPCLTFLSLNQKEDYGQNNLGSFCITLKTTTKHRFILTQIIRKWELTLFSSAFFSSHVECTTSTRFSSTNLTTTGCPKIWKRHIFCSNIANWFNCKIAYRATVTESMKKRMCLQTLRKLAKIETSSSPIVSLGVRLTSYLYYPILPIL